MESSESRDFDDATIETTDNENTNSDSGDQISRGNEDGKDVTEIENRNAEEQLEDPINSKSNSANDTLAQRDNSVDNNADDKLESESKVEGEEESECTHETVQNNTDMTLHTTETESSSVDKELESVIKAEVTKEDISAILSLKQNSIRKNNPNENIAVSRLNMYSIASLAEENETGIFIDQNTSKDNINYSTVELRKTDEGRNSPEIVVEPKIAERLQSGKITPQIIKVITPVNGTIPVGLKLLPKPLQISKKRTCFKKFRHGFLLITFTILVAGYAIGGAYLFSHLERQRDIEHNAKINKWKNDTAILLATELRQVKPHEGVWARKVFHYLEVYEKDLLQASALGYRRQDHKDGDQRWSWTSSLFFSVSLMTSSGYGSMTPRSKMGRVTATLYSLFGIPLTFTWLVVIGQTLATIWLSFFQNICCHLCREKVIDRQSKLPLRTDQNKLPSLPKLKSNSIVPVEKQKLLSEKKVYPRNSGRWRFF